MGSYKETCKTKKASALKKCKRTMEIHNTGKHLGVGTAAAKARFVTASSCPAASWTASPRCTVANAHPATEVTVWGTVTGDPHQGVPGTSWGGHWLILYSSLIARKLHAANRLIKCFDPDLGWTARTDQVFPVTRMYGIPSAHLSHLGLA